TYDAGFCDQSHLDRCFQKVVGLTPKEYRASLKTDKE
ncbi:MAG: helix-turn-helix transcriptional regulator, partial [Treponema sp.]|nr:helix-turn-helix transcriptional regulator [Treponema sp.]